MREEINITEIAKQANVSRTTVMNVLNGRRDKMKEETYRRITQIIKRTGYVKRAAPALLAGGHSHLVVVMLKRKKRTLHDYQSILSIIISLEKHLSQINYYLIFHSYKKKEEVFLFSRAWKTEAVILFGDERTYQYISKQLENPIKNLNMEEIRGWSEEELDEQMALISKELLALSRKCGKI